MLFDLNVDLYREVRRNTRVWAIRGDQALPTGFWAALKSHHSGGHEPAPLVVGQVTNLHTLGHLRSLRDPDHRVVDATPEGCRSRH